MFDLAGHFGVGLAVGHAEGMFAHDVGLGFESEWALDLSVGDGSVFGCGDLFAADLLGDECPAENSGDDHKDAESGDEDGRDFGEFGHEGKIKN